MILMILRHGKAEKGSPTGRDVDRPLAKKGRRQAEFIAESLTKARPPLAAPAAVLSSRAERARATATIVADALKVPVVYDDALAPDTTDRRLSALVHRLAKAGTPALLVGHNPQLEDLAATLAGVEEELRTGELIAFEVRADGKDAKAQPVATLRLQDEG